MTVLLLGGTGAIGTYLSELLAQGGVDVMVTSRSPHPDTEYVRHIVGNAYDVRFLYDLLNQAQPDAIVDFMNYSVVDFLKRRDFLLSHVGQYLFLSSYRVFSAAQKLTEASPRILDVSDDLCYLESDTYELSKAREENLIRESKFSHWTILRPTITYSKKRFQFGCLEADTICYRSIFRKPIISPVGMLDKITTLTWGKDVARMIYRLIGNARALGEDFNLASGHARSWREILAIYQKIIGLDIREVPVEDYCQVCARTQLYDRMVDRVLDNSKVLSVTGISQGELAPPEVALVHELKNFMQAPEFHEFNVAANAKMDLLCQSRLPWSAIPKRVWLEYFSIRYPRFDFLNDVFKGVRRIGRHFISFQ